MPDEKPNRPLSTPWRELHRYGLRRAFLSRITASSFVVALTLSFLIPWGQRDLLPFLAGCHIAMLGFGLTVFGFTILGGKDDFFEPVMRSLGRAGLDALRDMVLHLWWPLLLHGVAFGLCCGRMLQQEFWRGNQCASMVWRVSYLFVGIWSVLQSHFSMRYLFTLAITRLRWRFREMQKDKDAQSPPAGGERKE